MREHVCVCTLNPLAVSCFDEIKSCCSVWIVGTGLPIQQFLVMHYYNTTVLNSLRLPHLTLQLLVAFVNKVGLIDLITENFSADYCYF